MDILALHGMVLKSADYSEYDRRLTVLTAERGKITVFAKGVKRPGNRLMASTQTFAFGIFRVVEGKSAYNLRDAEISNYFDEIRSDLSAFYLGSYFLEFADYYSRENIEDTPLLSLIYTSLLALLREDFDNGFIRAVFEIKVISIEGELPEAPESRIKLNGTRRALEHIISSPPEKLYTFNVNEDVLAELKSLSAYFLKTSVRHEFSSLKIFEQIHDII